MTHASDTCCDRTAAALHAGRTPEETGCATCQALVVAAQLGEAPQPVAFDAASAFAGLQASMAQEDGVRGRMRAWPTWLRLTAVLGVVLAVALLNATFAPRPDLTSYPLNRMLGTVLLLIGAGWAVAQGALWPLQRTPLSTPFAVGLALLGLAVPLLIALAPEAPATVDMCTPPAAMFPQKVIACLTFGVACAAPAIAATVLLARHTLSLREGLLLASAGALCGEVGLQIHCPIVGREHQLLGHVPVILALGAAIAMVILVRNRLRKR